MSIKKLSQFFKKFCNTKGIQDNFFKLRISEFQALAIPAMYKLYRNHCYGLGF